MGGGLSRRAGSEAFAWVYRLVVMSAAHGLHALTERLFSEESGPCWQTVAKREDAIGFRPCPQASSRRPQGSNRTYAVVRRYCPHSCTQSALWVEQAFRNRTQFQCIGPQWCGRLCGRGDSIIRPASSRQTMPRELVRAVVNRPIVPTRARSCPGLATGIATGNCSLRRWRSASSRLPSRRHVVRPQFSGL